MKAEEVLQLALKALKERGNENGYDKKRKEQRQK